MRRAVVNARPRARERRLCVAGLGACGGGTLQGRQAYRAAAASCGVGALDDPAPPPCARGRFAEVASPQAAAE